MPEETGFTRAKEVLKSIYSQPHIIARDHIKSLTEKSQVRSSSQLSEFSMQMIRSDLVLSQLAYKADLNNSENLLKIVRKLPNYIRGKWVYQADRIIMSGKEPNFSNLTSFVEDRARAANNVFYEDLNVPLPKPKSKTQTTLRNKLTTMATASMSDNMDGRKYKICENMHSVSRGGKFISSLQKLSTDRV